MIQVLLFIIAAIALAIFSRRSLLNFRAHGFSRFFAWLAMLALVLLRIQCWFCEPFAWYQLLSWVLLAACLLVLIPGLRALRSRGRPDETRNDPGLVGIEKTTVLVQDGIYRFIRHPLYSSLLFFTWGTFFKSPDAAGGIIALVATLFLVLTARSEEAENIAYFGEEYASYRKRTRAFIPYLL